jgi:hypothetical protein
MTVASGVRAEPRHGLAWAVLLHGLIAVAVFSPFVFRGLLPLWSTDNFYGSYPFLPVSRESLWQGWSAWLPYSQSGTDFAGNVTNLSFSPLLVPLLLLPESWLWIGLGVVQLLAYWGLGVLFFLIARREIGNFGWALVAASAYQLSTPLLLTLQAFPMICVVVFMLLCLHAVMYLDQLSPARALLYLTGALTGLLLSGHYVQTAYAGVLIVLFFLHRYGFRPREFARFGTPTTLFVTASAVAVALCAFRLLPIAAAMQHSNRLSTAIVGNHTARPHALLELIFPEIFGVTVYDPLGLASTASQFGAASGNSYVSFPGSMVGLFNQCGAVVMLLMVWSLLDRRARADGIGFWKGLSLFCLAYLANIWPIPFIANLLVHPFEHGSFFQLAIPFAFCMLAGKAGVVLTAVVEKGEDSGFHRPAMLVAAAAVYAAMVFSFLWQEHPLALTVVRAAILLPIGAAALAYGLREDRDWAGKTADLARAMPWLVLAGVAVFSVGKAVLLFTSDGAAPGGVFTKGVWQQVGMAAILVTAVYRLRGGVKYAMALLALLGFTAMIWPWHLSGSSLRLTPMTAAEALVLAGNGACLSVMILAAIWAAARAVQRSQLSGGAFCGLCLLLSVGHSLAVWKETDTFVSQPFVSTLGDGGILARRPNYQDMDLHNYRVSFPHGLLEPRGDFVPPPGIEPLSNLPLLLRISSYGGHNGHFSPDEQAFFNSLSGSQDSAIGLLANATNDRFLDLIGVRYDFRDGNLRERPSALARVMLFSSARVETDPARQLAQLGAADFQPMSEILVDATVAASGPKQAARMLAYESPTNDRLSIDVSGGGGVLLFNDTWASGWTATIDGVSTPIMHANFKAMAVSVPSAAHRVEFRYHSAWRAGLAGAVLGLAGLGLSLLWLLQSRRKPGVSA